MTLHEPRRTTQPRFLSFLHRLAVALIIVGLVGMPSAVIAQDGGSDVPDDGAAAPGLFLPFVTADNGMGQFMRMSPEEEEAYALEEASADAKGKAIFFAADGLRQDIVEYLTNEPWTVPFMRRLLNTGVKAADHGLLTQAPPNTGAGWHSLATGAWPATTGSTNKETNIKLSLLLRSSIACRSFSALNSICSANPVS